LSISILVVDDEPDVVDLFRQRFRRELRSGAYVLHFAASGRDALMRLETGVEPELLLILSDINMPEMDGLQLLREVKRRSPGMPVMMLTAYADDARRRAADAAGAADFLGKPIDFDHLKRRIEAFAPTAAPS
jgi:CheY-like chemotaxis protein